MLRLTVGRRLALVVAIAIAVIAIVVVLLLRQQRSQALERAVDDLNSIAVPIAELVDNEIEEAGQRLEFEAQQLRVSDRATVLDRLDANGFIASEILTADAEISRLEASSNFLNRAAEATSVGATRIVSGRVGVLIGTPIPGPTVPTEILVGFYDFSGTAQVVESAQSGSSTEAALAARNSEGELVIFTRSRHNDDQPIGPVDETTAEWIDEAMTFGVPVESESVVVNGRDSVSVAVPIDSANWTALATIDVDDAAPSTPAWLVPLFVAIGLAALVPIALLRRRLREVVRGAQQLSRGRLNHALDDGTDDEIGQIARTLQILDDRLQHDTEQRGRSAALLQHRATHDPLTGLANRSRLREELAVALNNRDPVSVLFCDIDDFKGINDLQGHEGGDVVLKFVANQLASVCGPTELIARFGGDEFCVLSRTEAQASRQLASRVERALDTTCLVNGEQQPIGGSVGLAIAKVTDTPDSVLKSADLAMYREKERRRGLRRAQRRSDEEVHISPEQIRLAFQPVVELIEERIVGVEVLARYMHPELGLLDPSSFLPPGTEQGMFDKLDLEIMTQSIRQLSEWLSHGVVDERFTMSLNLSPDHVSDSGSTRQIFDILRQHRIPASMVQVEVTEHRLLAHEDDLVNQLSALRERGIKIAIDDFGIEGSNVDRLVQIPSDVVKVDRSYVSQIDLDERAENRLRAIVEIVKGEGRVPIAEGVERQGQARVLRELRVPFGQGYLWHAPISALALTPLLGRASRWTRKKPPPDLE